MKKAVWTLNLMICLMSISGYAFAADTFASCTDRSGRLIVVDQADSNLQVNVTNLATRSAIIYHSPATSLQDSKVFTISAFEFKAPPTALGRKGIMISVDLTEGKGALAENGLVEPLDCAPGEG